MLKITKSSYERVVYEYLKDLTLSNVKETTTATKNTKTYIFSKNIMKEKC